MKWDSDEFKALFLNKDFKNKQLIVLYTMPLVYQLARNQDEQQQAVLSIYAAIETYNPEKGPWGPWVKRKIKFDLYTHRRREWKREQLWGSISSLEDSQSE